MEDTGGQRAGCDAFVTIIDPNDPVLSCPDDIVLNVDPGESRVVNYDAVGYEDCSVAIDGFTFLMNANGNSYYISNDFYTGPNARIHAEANGGFVASILSRELNEEIFFAKQAAGFGTTAAWIGISDADVEGTFEWHDGSSTAYTNWADGEPSGSSPEEDYVIQSSSSGNWFDLEGVASIRYIFQITNPEPSFTQTAGLSSGSEFPIGTTTNTFEVSDGSGNVSTCSFDVTVAVNPFETSIDLTAGSLTITDINGGVSDDALSFEVTGTDLIVTGLVAPVDDNGQNFYDTGTGLATIPMSGITNGINIQLEDGTNTVFFEGDLTLSGADNDLNISGLNATGIQAFDNNGHINLGGDFIISDSANAFVVLGQLTANNMNISDVKDIRDRVDGLPISIAGDTNIQVIDRLDIIENNTNVFTGTVNLEAGRIIFSARGPLTFGTVTTTDGEDTATNNIRATPDNMILTGDIVTAGNSDLTLRAQTNFNQSGGTITTDELEFIGRVSGETTGIFFGDNNINTIGTQPGTSMGLIVFNNISELEIGWLEVTATSVFAPTINLSENTTIFKNGDGNLSLGSTGVINAVTSTGSSEARIDHNGGTIEFVGTSINIDELELIADSGTLTRFLGDTQFNPTDISLLNIQLGALEVQGAFDLGTNDLEITVLDDIDFQRLETIVSGQGSIVGNSTVVRLDATIQPGGGSAPATLSLGSIEFNEATFAPLVQSDTEFDVLEITGTITLTNVDFAPTGGFRPEDSLNEIVLIQNDGSDPIVGTFNDLPEGAAISFGPFGGAITYTGGDGNDFALIVPETTVIFSGGELSMGDANVDSDDTYTISVSGGILTVTDLTTPVVIFGDPGVTLTSPNTIEVAIADITKGFIVGGGDGTDTLNLVNDLTLTSEDNYLVFDQIDNYVQTGAIEVSKFFVLQGDDVTTVTMGEITAGSLEVDNWAGINDSSSPITVTGATFIEAQGPINIDEGQFNHEFGGIVRLVGSSVVFTSGSDTTFGIIRAQETTTVVNDIIVNPGNIIFDGDIRIAGDNVFSVATLGDVTQTDGTLEAFSFEARSLGGGDIVMDQNNEVDGVQIINISGDGTSAFNSISFTDVSTLGFGRVTVDEFNFTAPNIFLSSFSTNISKNGTGTSNFNGTLEVFDPDGSTTAAIIDHNAGILNFNGSTTFGAPTQYLGEAGTTTNFNGNTTILDTDPLTNLTFGNLNAQNELTVKDASITLLNQAQISTTNGVLIGDGSFVGGTVKVINEAVANIGVPGDFYNLTTSNFEVNAASFSPRVSAPIPGESDVVSVIGTVTLTDATFTPRQGFDETLFGGEVILIDNDGTDPVVGTFNGYPESSIISFGDYDGVITYVGGDGNDVSLIQDTEDPVAVCSDLTLPIQAGVTVITGDMLDGGSTDNVGIVSYLIDGQDELEVTFADLGTFEVTITVIDAAGNSDECTANLTLTNGATLPILISEYQPITAGSDPQTIEIKGEPGESFSGVFVIIDGDNSRNGRGVVTDVSNISGSFNADGLLTATVPNLTNPTHTAVLTSSFSGTVNETDIDTNDDGTADDLSFFGVIFDAVGVSDGGACCPLDVLYGTDFGGVDLLSIGGNPSAIFREASIGDFYQISVSTDEIFDSNGTLVDASSFDTTPTDAGTFGSINPSQSLIVSIKVFLQGAYINPFAGQESRMRDDLRVANLIPATSPYGDGLTASYTPGEPNNNIVDWVWVELRDPTNNATVITGRSALLQRDGDIVDVDGTTDLSLSTVPGDYLILVQHRNHLGVLSSAPVSLAALSTANYDFTTSASAYEGGSIATVQLANGYYALISGDLDGNTQIQNTDLSTIIPLLGGAGYESSDLDMNGQIQNADINLILNPNLGKGEQF
ncbi:HYR domain-containing protein [Gilvibacter sp.]|uniref:HYR domain-containing protein n=1 Tax=Gilvibacter sp. TaxID=2729997 RepID=UPI003F49C7BF